MDTESLSVNHLDVRHRLSQERIAIMLGYAVASNIVFVRTIKETPAVLELQLVLTLNHNDSGIPHVVLVCNAVMESFKYRFIIILHPFTWNQPVVWEYLERIVPDSMHHLCSGQQERYGKHLTHIVLGSQPPNDLADIVKIMHRLRLAKQQDGSLCNLPVYRQLRLVQEHLVTPSVNLFLQFGIVLLETFAGNFYCFFIQICYSGTVHNLL